MTRRSHGLRIGLIAVAAGLGLAALIYTHPEQLRAPAWVAYLASASFVVAGLAAVAREFGRTRLGDGLACLILAGMLVTGGWIALGPGTRQCLASGWHLGAIMSEGACRGVFGLGAAVTAIILIHALRRLVRPRMPE